MKMYDTAVSLRDLPEKPPSLCATIALPFYF